MRILIIGGGNIGYTLAESLSAENHDVTVIDNDAEVLQTITENLDVMLVKGSGSSLSTLKQAGAEHAGVVIAVTKSDEINMLCCVMARKLGTKRTAARIRDPDNVRDGEEIKRQLNIDFVINPERGTAGEILRLLRFPAAVEIDTFYRGRVELIGFRVTQGDRITGLSVSDIRNKLKAQVLFCIIERDGEVHVPHSSFVINDADLVYAAGKYTDITKFFRSIGRARGMAEKVMILGGGRTTHYLAMLAISIGIKPVVIEPSEKLCARLAQDIPQVTVINGDGTDQDLLESENIRNMDAFVSLSESDEENMIISLFAKQCGVPKVVAKSENSNYVSLVNSLGVESIISPTLITSGHILHFVRGLSSSRGGAVISLSRLLEGRVEALEFVISEKLRHPGEKIKDLPIKRGVVIAVISRGGKSIIPEDDDVLMEGDDVVVVTRLTGFSELNDIFER